MESQEKIPISNKDFFGLLGLAIRKHGCEIVNIDFEAHTINIAGPTPEAEIDAAQELELLFGKYLLQD